MRELSWQILEDDKSSCKWNIIGYIDNESLIKENALTIGGYSIPYLGDDRYLLGSKVDVNVVISIGQPKLRKRIVDKYIVNNHIHFPNIILSSACVCNDLKVGQGCVITMDARVSTNTKMGDFVFMNTGSMICHDGCIGDYVTFSPRTQVAGAVTIGDNTEIGMNASIIQGVTVGKNVVIGAGAVVVADVGDDSIVVGVPARKVKK